MGLFSSLFGGTKTYQPNTSLQEAEARRQYEAEAARFRELLDEQRRIAEEQRADADRRYREQLAAQQAEAQRQREFTEASQSRQLQAQYDEARRQEALQRELEGNRQADRAADMARAKERADAARAYAEGRQQKMDEGRAAIDEAYSGFDEGYFENFAKSFVGQFKPQAERAYDKERRGTTFAYGDAGNLRSSAAARAFGDLKQQLTDNEGKIAGAASDASQNFRNDIEGQKSDATQLIYSAGAVGNELLPERLSDVGSMLEGVGSQIGALTTTAQRRAQSIKAPSFSGTNLNLNFGVNKPTRTAAL